MKLLQSFPDTIKLDEQADTLVSEINETTNIELVKFSSRKSITHVELNSDVYSESRIDKRALKFEEPDSKDNILFDNTTQEIKAATIEKLIQKLTSDKYLEHDLLNTFLLCHVSFSSSKEIFQILKLRYNTPFLTIVDSEELKKILLPIRFRIFHIIKMWIDNYVDDFLKDTNLHNVLFEFLDNIVSKSAIESVGIQIKQLYEKKKSEKKVKSLDVPIAISPSKRKMVKMLKFVDINPNELARQLTLIEMEMFIKIEPREFLLYCKTKTNKKNLSNIQSILEHFQIMTNWVSSEILKPEDPNGRAQILNKFITIANKCFKLNNFNSLMEIVSSLKSEGIARLKETWQLITAKSIEKWKKLSKLMDPQGNYELYRVTLRDVHPPFLPYVGLHFMDLRSIDENNSEIVNEMNSTGILVNWQKARMLFTAIKEYQNQQGFKFPFEKSSVIIDYILTADRFDEQEIYKLSIEREKKRPNSNSNNVFFQKK